MPGTSKPSKRPEPMSLPSNWPRANAPDRTRWPGSSAPAPGGVSRIQHRAIPATRAPSTAPRPRHVGLAGSSITAGRLTTGCPRRPSIGGRGAYTRRRWSTPRPRWPHSAPRSSGCGVSSDPRSGPTRSCVGTLLAARDAAKEAEAAAGEVRGELTEVYVALARARQIEAAVASHDSRPCVSHRRPGAPRSRPDTPRRARPHPLTDGCPARPRASRC